MSEFSLIRRHFAAATTKHADTTLGIGDDCAVSRVPLGYELVSCIDTLVAGRHFPNDTDPFAIGFKSVAVNLSDLAAMGARPFGILLALSLPAALANDDFLGNFTRGISQICTQFGVELIGGDTTRSPILTISVTALGSVPQGTSIQRNGATIGDVICVSGEIGSANFALMQILQGHQAPLRSALDLPQPQVTLGQSLRGYASAMLDISDGLGQDLGHILAASGVGAAIELEKIPTHNALKTLPNDKKWQHILNGGDDYQLLFTISPDKLAEFSKIYPNSPIYPIGQIIAGDSIALSYHGAPVDFTIKGWTHF